MDLDGNRAHRTVVVVLQQSLNERASSRTVTRYHSTLTPPPSRNKNSGRSPLGGKRRGHYFPPRVPRDQLRLPPAFTKRATASGKGPTIFQADC
jgi:hypothetical protein